MKHSKAVISLGLILAGALGSAPAALAVGQAGSSEAETSSARMDHKLGAYVGIGEPAPSILGLNVGYHLTDFLSAHLGLAQISTSLFGLESSATTIGFGVRGCVPKWSLTPTAGLHFANVSYTGSGLSVGGFTASGSHLYMSVGMDYQAKSGFHSALGYAFSTKSGIGGSAYLNVGWYFDIFG